MENLQSVILRNDDESGRLSAIKSYELRSDDASSVLFHDLVKLAQTMVGSQMAFISLVEEDRQWFKASIGLDVSETPRNIAFCDHAIRQDEVLVILDAANDPRFADNPLVTGSPYIRFYAGAPIIDRDGFALGTICLADPEPRECFHFADSLAAMAQHAAELLDLRRRLIQQRRAANLANDQRDRLWDHSLDMMLIAHTDGRIIAGNPAWENTFGEVGSDDKNNITDYFDDIEERVPTKMEAGQKNVLVDRQMRNRNGELIYASWNLARDGDLIFGIARDLTQVRATQQQLAHAQRMESIGQLTGGIAHDFNNLLTIILGNLDIAAQRITGVVAEPEEGPKNKNNLEKAARSIGNARDGAQRAANLTQRLLAFARRQSLSPEHVRPDELVRDFEPLARQALDERFTLEISIPDAISPVEIDPGQLENAILNLIVNARDSMRTDSGEANLVQLMLSETELSPEMAKTLDEDAKAGRFVKICVADNGTGIAPDIASKIFEPFFTTKDVGRGTGLGLSQVQGFVVQSGGFVTLDTTVGKGTIFSIWLPVAENIPPATEIASSAIQTSSTDPLPVSGTILLVEDNRDLRDHIAALLEEQGFTVEQAADGMEAHAFLSGNREMPILVLSDITMPRMDGYQLAQFIAQEKLDIPVILMTGYASSEAPKNCEFEALITKPFSSDEIINIVTKTITKCCAKNNCVIIDQGLETRAGV